MVVAERLHLVRHGEVENPGGVVYGRLADFHLSDRGRRQASAAARALLDSGADVRRVLASPLERAVESADPIGAAFGVDVETDDAFLEATSRLEGKAYDVSLAILRHPEAWRYLTNPMRPSWGEAYRVVLRRMRDALDTVMTTTADGEVVVVSHQLPIWVVVRQAAGKPLFHDPRRRQCAHSSITTFDYDGRTLHPARYQDPGRDA